MQGVILCAGEGERLRPITLKTPKPLLPIRGRPLLEWTVEWLRRFGVKDLFINLHHLPDAIPSHLGTGAAFGVRVTYSFEKELLGTAGALRAFRDRLRQPFVVVYGDVLPTALDLDALRAYHRAKGGIGTLVLQKTDRPHDSDVVELEEDGRVKALHHAPGTFDHGDLGSAAVYLLEPGILRYLPESGKADFVRDLFPAVLQGGERLYGYVTEKDLPDVGTPERYEKTQRRTA